MVILYHNNNRITKVFSEPKQILPFNEKLTIAEGLVELALQFPKSQMIWCHQDLKEHFNSKEIGNLFHHDKLLLSYNPSNI